MASIRSVTKMSFLKTTAVILIILVFFTRNSSGQVFERYRNLKDTSILSEKLGYRKKIQITVPIEYQDDLKQSFPVILIFDMQNQRAYQYLLKTIDYLTANEQMPSSIVVGVEAGRGSNRYLETQLKVSDTSGKGEKNEAYIFKELLPLVRNNFKSSPFTVLVGHSRYGYFTSYLLTKHITELNAVVSISPFLKQPGVNIADLLPTAIGQAHLNHTVYYRYAMGNDYPTDYQQLSQVVKTGNFSRKLVDADGWLFPQADHNTTPALAIGRSLCEIFGFWHQYQVKYLSDANTEVKKILAFKDTIDRHYGTPLAFSLGTLNGKGYAFYNKANYPDAIAAWQQLVLQYPNFSQAYLDIARCQKKLNQPTTQTIQQFKASVQQSSIFPAKEKAEMIKEADSF